MWNMEIAEVSEECKRSKGPKTSPWRAPMLKTVMTLDFVNIEFKISL